MARATIVLYSFLIERRSCTKPYQSIKLDRVNCARLRRPYGGLGGSVWVMGEWSVGH